MSPDDFRTAVDFIANTIFPRMKVGAEHHLTVEYLGGEVLLVPQDELEQATAYARDRLSPLVAGYRQGAQSNLIGSPRRIVELHDLFDGNLGTSWDQHTGARNVKGSAELYRAILDRSLRNLSEERDHRPGRVLVVDQNTLPFVIQEVSDAIEGGYDLVLRPVFQGGSDGISPADPLQIAEVMQDAYKIWSASPKVRIEPFSSLKHRRENRGKTDCSGAPISDQRSGCPFQSDCAFKSLSLDPDGTIHICQEMADAGHYPLGNAIEGKFDERTWRLLGRRSLHLSDDCARCEWISECGGGCMNEAIQSFGDPFAKTELCPVWKSIFREIETDIASIPISRERPTT
jgi:radical SAM protein with 4Fe4S-binding SPASM domain